jgi:type I restriction enzyme R subunit
VVRYEALDEDDQADFKDALNGFVRAYAFLGQIVPFTDTDLEKLYYFGKYLLTKLPSANPGGSVDLSGAVVLTHLRTELVTENAQLILDTDPVEPLDGHTGGGRGKQADPPMSALSTLIASLNDRFGMNLGDADRVWFEQQQEHLHAQEDVRVVALGNDREQFGVFLRERIEEAIVERHEANGELFGAFFGREEFREAMEEWITQSLYDRIRREGEAS